MANHPVGVEIDADTATVTTLIRPGDDDERVSNHAAPFAFTARVRDLLTSMSQDDFGNYFNEAVTCFEAGAHRGAILMCFNAVFLKLRRELEELAAVDFPKAATSLDEIRALASNDKSFEGKIFSFFNNWFDPKQKAFLSDLCSIRNKLAHATAREADGSDSEPYIRKSFELFLSKRDLSLAQAIAFVLKDLRRFDYFKDLESDTIVRTVLVELQSFKVEDHVRLVDELITIAELPGRGRADQLPTPADWTAATNAEFFLCGMLLSNDLTSAHGALCINRVRRRAFGERQWRDLGAVKHRYLISLMTLHPDLFWENKPQVRQRMTNMICEHLRSLEALPDASSTRHPVNLLDSLCGRFDGEREDANTDLIITELDSVIALLRTSHWRNPVVSNWMVRNGHAEALFLQITEMITYTDDEEGRAIDRILRGYHQEFAACVEAVDLVRMLWRSMEAPDGSALLALHGDSFFAVPAIRAAARHYVQQNSPEHIEQLGLLAESEPSRAPRAFARLRKP